MQPLSVVTNWVGKKQHLRHVNRFLWKQKFRYEDLCMAMMMFKQDVFASRVWPLLSNLEAPELRRLVKALPATVLRSRADSIPQRSKYLGAYQLWKSGRTLDKVPSFPVQERHLVLYLQQLSESMRSKAAIEETVHALSWLHELVGLQQLG